MIPSTLLTILLLTTPAASQATHDPAPGTFFLRQERVLLATGGFLEADRGTIYVPANRSRPESGVIALEVYRFPASESAPQDTPPIFYLPGGPRFDGLGGLLREPGGFERQFGPFLECADLVVVSQRGIGPSVPSTVIETTTPSRPPDRPYGDAATSEAFRAVLSAEKTVWERAGVDLQGLSVIEAAADVNDVRKALGYDRIQIWGGSFGSHWGMALMRYHPETLARAVLRGMEGPDHTYDHPGHVWNVYRRVAAEAERVPGIAERVPSGGLMAAVERTISQVEAAPVTVTVHPEGHDEPVDVFIDGHVMRQLVRGYSGGMTSWPADMIALVNGDFTAAAEAIAGEWLSSEGALEGHWDQARQSYRGRTFLTAGYFSLDCASGITPERLTAYRESEGWRILGDINWKYTAGCEVWDVDLGDAFRQNFVTEIPTVIVHGTWDTSTPIENARELQPYFKNSTFVTVKRGPHGATRAAISASSEFRDGIWHFVRTGDPSNLPESVELPVDWVIPE